jgi:putative addiction module component (TIGR02574 family)
MEAGQASLCGTYMRWPYMSVEVDNILQGALALTLVERASLVEALLSSLDRPDPRIDELCASEAEERLAAFKAGGTQAIPAEEVFAELDRS